MISRIDHVAIAVRDYPKALDFFTKLMDPATGAADTEGELGFFWQVLTVGDLSRLELLAPSAEKSFLDSFLAEKQGGVHHITLQTADIEACRRRLDDLGIGYFGYNAEKQDWKELFIHPREAFGVLLQIAEFPAEKYLPKEKRLAGHRRWRIESTEKGGRLTLAHPGGGLVEVDLDRQEIEAMSAELRSLL